MAWYWWVLIAVALAAIGYVKVRVFAQIMRRGKGNDKDEEM